jgi:hypothetical protein
MNRTGTIATCAGLLGLGAVLGYGGYQWFGNSANNALHPSPTPVNQALVSPSTTLPSVTGLAPLNTSTYTNPSPAPLAPVAIPQANQAQPIVQLKAQRGMYAPAAAPLGGVSQSTVTTREYSSYPTPFSEPVPVSEQTVTKTSVRTAYAPPPSSVHRVYVQRRVRNEKPGNIHVVRALKHTIAFTAKFPFRLRP